MERSGHEYILCTPILRHPDYCEREPDRCLDRRP